MDENRTEMTTTGNEVATNENQSRFEVGPAGAVGILGLAAVGGVTLAVKGFKGGVRLFKAIKKALKEEKEGVQTQTQAKVDGQPVQAEVVNKPQEGEAAK